VDFRRSLDARPGLLLWGITAGTLGGFTMLALRGPLDRIVVVAPDALFWLVVVAASLCWLGSLVLMTAGWRRGSAELTILGGAFAVLSAFGLVHGLTVPGVLFGSNNAVSSAAFLALPVALVAAGPVLVRNSALGTTLGLHWRGWSLGWLAVGTVVGNILLVRPDLLPAPTPGSWFAVAAGLFGLLGMLALSYRQLHLYWVGRLRTSLVASLALLWLGLSSLVWLGRGPFTLGFWVAHTLDIIGVSVAVVAMIVGYRANRSFLEVMDPVLIRDPLAALDLGLSPTAHRFVAMLDRKDEVSRDHVVRVGELAMRAGERGGFRGTALRNLGLAALFHDIGKLEIPLPILAKPGSLTEREMAVMRTHPVIGARLMAEDPELAPAASFVRWHHERTDGTGYPDGLAGAEIPPEVSIISACDAYDAMCHTRHYREGMGTERALAILGEHAGIQWSIEAVALVASTVGSGALTGTALDGVGRQVSPDEHSELACGCIDALPDATQALALDWSQAG